MSNLIGGVAVIEKGGKHLLIRQSLSKPLGGKWRHVGGRFEPGEDPVSGLKREVREEVGLEIEVTDREPVMVMESDYHTGEFGFFMAGVVSGELKIDKREIEDAGWFSPQETKKLDLMNATKRFYQGYSQGWTGKNKKENKK